MTTHELITPGNRAARGHTLPAAYDNPPTPDEYAGLGNLTPAQVHARLVRTRAEWRAADAEGRAAIEARLENDPWKDEDARLDACSCREDRCHGPECASCATTTRCPVGAAERSRRTA